MNILDWIGTFFSTLQSLVPTWRHVECIDAAAYIKRGSQFGELQPGIHWYWPFWTTILSAPRNRQVKTSRPLPLQTQDGIVVAARPVVRYVVQDAVKALIDTHDLDDSVVDETAAVLRKHVAEHTLKELQTEVSRTNAILTKRVQRALEKYGVLVERAQLSDFAESLILFHVWGDFKDGPGVS